MSALPSVSNLKVNSYPRLWWTSMVEHIHMNLEWNCRQLYGGKSRLRNWELLKCLVSVWIVCLYSLTYFLCLFVHNLHVSLCVFYMYSYVYFCMNATHITVLSEHTQWHVFLSVTCTVQYIHMNSLMCFKCKCMYISVAANCCTYFCMELFHFYCACVFCNAALH